MQDTPLKCAGPVDAIESSAKGRYNLRWVQGFEALPGWLLSSEAAHNVMLRQCRKSSSNTKEPPTCGKFKYGGTLNPKPHLASWSPLSSNPGGGDHEALTCICRGSLGVFDPVSTRARAAGRVVLYCAMGLRGFKVLENARCTSGLQSIQQIHCKM